MRKQTLLGLLGLLGFCCSVFAAAGDERPVAPEKSSVTRAAVEESAPAEDLAMADEAPGVPPDMTPVDLDPNIYFEPVIMGADGQLRPGKDQDEGSVAGPGERLIYKNTLGLNGVNFPTNQPLSDDIATTAPNGCNLTRYKFKVLGKVNPGGTGGAFTMTYGLYTNCPNAAGSTNAQRDLVKIPGTDGVVNFPDDLPRDFEHIVPGLTPVALPTNVYFGLRFNRGNCGTVVGAPAEIGFSGDLWDTPGFACNGFLGGFPGLPHSSFWLEMYGTTNCANSFAGYKCNRASGGPLILGSNLVGVDDVKLIVNNCQMVGYEVAVKGVGQYTFDLRRNCDGDVIAGTEQIFNINADTQPKLQIARFTFNPPINLVAEKVYLAFQCTSSASGVVVAGLNPIIGFNDVDIFLLGLTGCEPIQPTQGVHGAVHMAITCAGTLPLGACCDPHLTKCNLGPNAGKRCNTSADCTPPGTCEAVCRETSELNCPFPPRGQVQKPKWELGGTCNIVCTGGTNAGNPCTSDIDCPGGDCPAPFAEECGMAACCRMRVNPNTLLLEEVCENMTRNQCAAAEPLEKARLWQLGEYCGLEAQRCPRNACLARNGSCYVPHGPPDSPGCSDPFCCTDVCTLHGAPGSYCCDVNWDNACVAFADIDCTRAPGNDQCAPGFPERNLEGAQTIPYPGSATNNNEKATNSSLDPGFCCHNGTGVCLSGTNMGAPCIINTDCGGSSECTERVPAPGAAALNTLWFKFTIPPTAPNPSSAQISTCNSNSPATDSVMQVFKAQNTTSPSDECLSLTPVGCNDDAENCGSTQRNSKVCLTGAAPGDVYYVLIGSKTLNRLGQYRVTLATSCVAPTGTVANDTCVKASAITDATPLDPLVIPFNLGRVCVGGANAGLPCENGAGCPGGSCPSGVATYDCPSESCVPGAQNDLWYNYTATCTGELTVTTCGGLNPDTNLVVYDGCTQCPGPQLLLPPMEGGCHDDIQQGGCGLSSKVVVNVVQGQCYKIRLSDQEGFAVAGNMTITCANDPCPGLAAAAPKCVGDARRPHAPNLPGTLQNQNTMQMTFDPACNMAAAAPSDFSIACIPGNSPVAPCPTISNVNAVGQVVTVTLSAPIPAGYWTCVTHTATGAEFCAGSLPGDANGNLTTVPADILTIIDNLNGVVNPALTLNHCDIDRSGLCLPADIIALIDMLNGANGYIVWNGKTLPVCPAN